MRLNYIDNVDCLEGLKKIPDKSVDLIIADPPYGIDFQSNSIKDKSRRKAKIANDKTPFIWWLYDAARVLKDTGALVCFARWDVQETFRECISIAGMKVQNVCIWSKGGGGMGNLKASFSPDHEVFLFATKPEFCFPAGRPASVLNVAKVPSGKLVHPNEKPTELISTLIERLTPEHRPRRGRTGSFYGQRDDRSGLRPYRAAVYRLRAGWEIPRHRAAACHCGNGE